MTHDLLKSLRVRRPRWLFHGNDRTRRILLQSRELLFERLFSNALPRLKIEHRYFPHRNAANYSLLYLILRVITELPVRRVLELGCGQTTLLLDDLARVRDLEITTVEHDAAWAARMQKQVRHSIIQAPLTLRDVHDTPCQTYDLAPAALGGPMDLIVVDGPVSQRRRSRWGTLEYLDPLLGRDFILLFDDAERRGDQDTIEATLRHLNARGAEIACAVTRARKSQFLIAGGAFREAAYY